MKLFVALLLLFTSQVSAVPHQKLDTYQFAIRVWCGDNITYLIHTDVNSPGVKITPEKNVTMMNALIYRAALQTGTAYDWQDCEFSITEGL